jgi:hypothetical protein
MCAGIYVGTVALAQQHESEKFKIHRQRLDGAGRIQIAVAEEGSGSGKRKHN